jgi:TRAP-type transport system periplasmic protein
MTNHFVKSLTLVTALFTSTSATADTIKLATIAPQDSPYYDILREMGDVWETASHKRIKLRIYASGVAGDESDVVRKMRAGQIHAAAMSGGGLNDIAPELRALQMPMMFRNDSEREYVVSRLHPQIETIIESRGFKVLSWAGAGWLYFYTQKPVISPDDLRPLAIYAWAGNSSYIEAWKAAGFRPIGLPSTEITTGLQSGLINAVSAPPLVALSFQWFGLASHMTNLKWAPLEGAIIMSRDTWDAIPPDVRPIIEDAAKQACAKLAQNLQLLSDQAVEVMTRHGLTVHPVPEAQVKEWEKAARAGYPLIAHESIQRALVAEAERLRDEFRATHPVE